MTEEVKRRRTEIDNTGTSTGIAGGLEHDFTQAAFRVAAPDFEYRHIRAKRLAAAKGVGKFVVQRFEIGDVDLEPGQAIQKCGVFQQSARFRQLSQAAEPALAWARTADEEALETEQRLGDGPAVVELTDKAVYRNAHVVEEDFAEFFFSGDVANRADGDPVDSEIDKQEADPGLRFG